ncbi:MAG: major facilitator superfamily domain-containing protein [Linnemannia gamsii]|nr:MAG: major facilitator superfamily domain-containing protein [Linnemannia gamsii]
MTDIDASTLASFVVPSTDSQSTSKEKHWLLPWYKRLEQKRGLLLLVASSAQLLDIISIASVTIALPSLLRDVHYEPNQLQWVISSYALTYSAFLLVGGRMGDLIGHRQVFLTGVFWFALWTLICGFARSPIFMSVARGLQGAGAGLTIPSAMALLTTSYPLGPERNYAMSVFGGAGCTGQTLGVLIGGIFDATIGWPWIFCITATLAFLVGIAGILVVSKSGDDIHVTDRLIDYVGVFTFMLGIICVLVYFVFWEHRIENPIMPIRIWTSARLRASVIVIVCITATYNTLIFYTSLTFQNVLLFSPLITACCYIVHGVGMGFGLYYLNKLYAIIRTKWIMLVGMILIVISAIIFAQIVPGSGYWHYAFPALIVNCLGQAPAWMCCQVTAVADAPDEDQGVVGAVFNVAIQLGGPIGLAISTIVNQKYVTEKEVMSPTEYMHGYRAAFYAMAVMGAVGFVFVVLLAANQDPIEFKGVVVEEKKQVEGSQLEKDVERTL